MSTDTNNENTDITVQEKQELTNEEGTWEGTWFSPKVDIFETEEALTVVADVPGTTAEGFEIDLRDNMLTITGRALDVEERFRPVYTEYGVGNFMRRFRLGQQIDQAKISASYDDGVLTVLLPKSDTHVPRKIEVS